MLKDLCLKLAYSDSEQEIINILKKEGYWTNSECWQYYGDNENNFATVGNQQSRPEAALVEKLVNSVDAVLMAECLKRKIDPKSNAAPQTINEALKEYFDIYNGNLSNLDTNTRKKIAENILLVATGKKQNPCYTIIDKGEGKYPDKVKSTFLSIGKSNKLRIPFVQGKFNMGGTGILQFCGENNIQLIITKRNNNIWKVEDSLSDNLWSFTVVRRIDPEKGARSSSYKYLAPDNSIMKFKADSLKLLPGDYPCAYDKGLEYGTFIKLYDYQMTGLKTNILFDLYNRLSLLMPQVALPIRLYERRKNYTGHTLETTMSGLSVRLLEDKNENIEQGFPTSSEMIIQGQQMKMKIFAFKKGKSEKYTKNEGIIFSVNGQTHGYLSQAFFSRQSVGMSYLANSLLVVVDCSDLDVRSREDLFMNSRDRLRAGDLRSKIENELQNLIANQQGLKDLRERRRREDIENKLEDSKPLADIIESIIRKSPALSKLFIQGVSLPNPFKPTKTDSEEKYTGEKFPTYFKLTKKYTIDKPKKCPINNKIRIEYTTDANNDYFCRDSDPGEFRLFFDQQDYPDYSINLWNGYGTLEITLPKGIKVGDNIILRSIVNDISRIEPFTEEFVITVAEEIKKGQKKHGERRPPSKKGPGDTGLDISKLNLPLIIEVKKEEWGNHGFDKSSALKVLDSGDNGYDFYINIDNIHLKTEEKTNTTDDARLLQARYKYGMVLIGIAMLKSHNDKKNDLSESQREDDENIHNKINEFTKAISPVLLPLISGLGDLEIESMNETFDDSQT